MKYSTFLPIVALLVSGLLLHHTALAAPPANKGHGTPPGFNKGKKQGWQSDVPPGLENRETPPGWNKGKKKGWDKKDRPANDNKDKNKKDDDD